MEAYKIENLTFAYPDRNTVAISDVNIIINRGEFVTLCGPSGSGKTTLLRHLKPSTVPHGVKQGDVFFDGMQLDKLSAREAAAKIGFVMQSPENQIVTDKVWHELAFGLESLGVKTPEIRLRVAEMASFFGIQTWFHKPVTELSGGQKQLLALASIMALQPSALILDEPTSQLDPIAAGEFLATVGKINRELGVTVILTEHRLEEAFPLSGRVVVMDGGRIIADGSPRDVGLGLRGCNHGMFTAMPSPMRIWAGVEKVVSGQRSVGSEQTDRGCPVTVRDGTAWLNKFITDFPSELKAIEKLPTVHCPLNTAISLDNIWFKYEKDMPDIVKGLSFKANYGEITAILGGNGTGKTTTLSLIAGLQTPYRGKVNIHRFQKDTWSTDSTIRNPKHSVSGLKVYTLPQNPQSLFVAKTVREDLLEILSERKISKDEKNRRLAAMVKLCRLDGLLDFHPYDLSGGEQQRAALAKILLLQPEILLLDEPTKGLDAEFKQIFAAILKKLAEGGAAVVMVSHDVEFCAEHAQRCALFFDGNIVTENEPRAFFSGNSFYTTAANRMSRSVLSEAITVSDVVNALGGELPPAPDVLDLDAKYELAPEIIPPPLKVPKLSKLRKIIAGAFGFLLLATIVFAGFNFENFRAFISGGSEAANVAAGGAWVYVAIMVAFAIGIIGLMLALTYKRDALSQGLGIVSDQPRLSSRLSKRTITATAVILLAIPLTIYVGSYFFGDRRYYFTSLLIILLTMLPFALVFETRKPQARELVIIAVLCAIAVAGRAAFFMLPHFKPVVALVIIAGVAFGGEAGFLVGAMTGFVSNFFFGQGPWTPYQMFAFGIIGLLSGVLFRKGLLRRTPVSLAIFGAFVTFVIYGGIMNPSFVMIYQAAPTRAMLLAAYLHGIPMDLVHAAATVTFLLIIARPMLEKLDRIKIKYGLVS